VKTFRFGIAELSINFHQYFLSRLLQFSSSLSQLVSDEDTALFLTSETMSNYNKFMAIFNQTDQSH